LEDLSDISNSSEILIELYKARHARLVQEYEISWQQIKIFAYISGVAIAGLGYILKSIETNLNALMMLYVISFAGFAVSMSSILIFIGSLKTAKEIRNDLASIEIELKVKPDIFRYNNFESTYSIIFNKRIDLITVGKMLLQITFIIFWVSVLLIIAFSDLGGQ